MGPAFAAARTGRGGRVRWKKVLEIVKMKVKKEDEQLDDMLDQVKYANNELM